MSSDTISTKGIVLYRLEKSSDLPRRGAPRFAKLPIFNELVGVPRMIAPDRVFSELEIDTYLEELLGALFAHHRWVVRRKIFPTQKQLDVEINGMVSALKRLKRALPDNKPYLYSHVSRLGQDYVKTHRRHKGYRSDRPDFRSDELLNDVSKGVSNILAWVEKTDRKMPDDDLRHWETKYPTVWLIGKKLPELYARTFAEPFGISRNGPGVRFVAEVLRRARAYGLVNREFSIETIIAYQQRAKRLAAK